MPQDNRPLPKTSVPSRRRARAAHYSKSAETEQAILEATVDCLCEDGIRQLTLQKVADRAGMTRSGVQYYANSTAALLAAVQAHIVDKVWGDDLRRSQELPAGPDRFARALDFAFSLPGSRYFIAWNELLVAARTDPALQEIVLAGARSREAIHDALFREFHADAAPASVAAMRSVDDLVVMALHAASFVRFAEDDGTRIAAALAALKAMVLGFFAAEKARAPDTP